jgi:GH15 family glucan-1,4-alpha-glucosidase
MLVLLLRTQVSDYWPMMEPHILQSLPPTVHSVDSAHMLASLMIGMAQVWLFTNKKQDSHLGFVITTNVLDLSETRTMLVYNAILLDKTAKIVWEEEWNTLRRYAKETGCTKIAAYVANSKIIKVLNERGADTKFTYVNMDL